jgi:hypothetical protein
MAAAARVEVIGHQNTKSVHVFFLRHNSCRASCTVLAKPKEATEQADATYNTLCRGGGVRFDWSHAPTVSDRQ